ncbi:uncharacterized protein LOC128883416 [Hylaeus volcanicus]|uniref:uncharacterized protein LOC128883416 n=1 Tax=Hylaeus volcanicus TaxID=313075 RepID=UPI0023B7B492|nr:uncharacterized protein LOC128883416 [Hylaeus volcanicus]
MCFSAKQNAHFKMTEKLCNNDFRNLIFNQIQTENDASRENKTSHSITAKKKHQNRYIQILRRQKKLREQEKKITNGVIKFRDRAAERRKMESDTSQVNHEYDRQKNCTPQESQYLGGDIEHTHLVKGLDYVLLKKATMDIQKKEEEKKTEGKKQNSLALNTLLIQKPFSSLPSFSGQSKQILHSLTYGLHSHHIAFEKKLQRLDSVLYHGSRFKGNNNVFASRTLFYQFNLTNDPPGIPFSIIHGATSQSSLHYNVIPLQPHLIKYLVPNSSRTLETLVSTLAENETQIITEDEDIFANVGTFQNVQELFESSSLEQKQLTTAPLSYFEALPANKLSEQMKTTQAREASTSSEQKEARLVQKMLQPRIDYYDECYPNPHVHSDVKKKHQVPKEETNFAHEKKSSFSSHSTKNKNNTHVPSARAVRRQVEREWKQLEGYMESKKHRSLDALESDVTQRISRKKTSANVLNVL